MLHLQAIFERKISEFPVSDCVIENIVELPETEYKGFRSGLLRDADFIAENKDLMYMDENGTRHCLLVLGENQPEGVLVELEGYDYARYASLLPGARDFVTARLNKMADQIIWEYTQNISNGTWTVPFNEIKERYGITLNSDNGIGLMLRGIMESKPEMAEVELMWNGYNMAFHPDHCSNSDEGSARQEPEESGMTMKF